jgi:hypothetical protein
LLATCLRQVTESLCASFSLLEMGIFTVPTS